MSEQKVSGRVVSKDGTLIAYDRVGRGPALIMVMGALCSRTLGPSVKLAPRLAPQFTVFSYDRRGRGESGDRAPYTVQREIEDLEALIGEAGGSALVFGHSSGAILALQAAARGLPIRKLALYEAPLILEPSGPAIQANWLEIRDRVARGDRSEALKVFLKSVGMPAILITVMRWLPVWKKILSVAHTLPYDGEISAEFQKGEPLPAGLWASVTVPTLASAGSKSPAWMQQGMRLLASVLPNAEYRTLPGQNHDASAEALERLVEEFLAQG